MTTNTALIEKREELKRRLAAGEYKTLLHAFFARTNSLIRKIARQPKPLPLWLITVTLIFVIDLISFLVIYVAGDMTTFHKSRALFGLGYGSGVLLVFILPGVLVVITLIVIHSYMDGMFVFWHDDMLDATESAASLDRFEGWLEKLCNWRLHCLVTVIGGLLTGSSAVIALSARLGSFIGYGFTIALMIIQLLGYAIFYPFLMVLLLSAQLRRYDLKLFAADPGNSEIVYRLSGKLAFAVYFFAVYVASLTLFAALLKLLVISNIFVFLILWLIIIAMFILNQTSLSTIIRRAKWKTLNEVQAKIEKLRASKGFGSPATMDAISKLLDYHDRVKATRNSAIDLGTVLNFINSLLLPLLAFILGNLDLVLNLFAKKP